MDTREDEVNGQIAKFALDWKDLTIKVSVSQPKNRSMGKNLMFART